MSADDAPVEVPPDVDVGWMSEGVESSDGVGNDVVVPRYRAVKTGDEMIEVPPDSSEDEINGNRIREGVSSEVKDDDCGSSAITWAISAFWAISSSA